jgi:tRNA1(Val) A37 N6-methylase TrmN6
MAPSDPGTTEDSLLDGKVIVRQPAKGFRAGVDSVLVAAAIAAPVDGRVLEIGCGVGAALLCAAVLRPDLRFAAVEREEAHARLAEANVAANGMAGRITVLAADPIGLGIDLGAPFDGAFCNPPFNAKGRAPDAARAHAHLTDYPLTAWVNAFANRLRGGAHLVMIHRAEALGGLLAACEGRLGGVCVRPVLPFADQPAHRVLIRATKGSRAGLTLLPPLVLHGAEGKHTARAEAILRGREGLGWN